jgi:hypothetical protein
MFAMWTCLLPRRYRKRYWAVVYQWTSALTQIFWLLGGKPHCSFLKTVQENSLIVYHHSLFFWGFQTNSLTVYHRSTFSGVSVPFLFFLCQPLQPLPPSVRSFQVAPDEVRSILSVVVLKTYFSWNFLNTLHTGYFNYLNAVRPGIKAW